MRLLVVFTLLALSVGTSYGQQNIDRIVAVIGEDIILKSDIDAQYDYMIASGKTDDGTLRCGIMEQSIVGRLLLNKAKQDSLVVGEDQVEGEVLRRIATFAQSVGGEKELEKIYKKSILEIKADLRPEIRDQLLMEQQRSKVMNSVTVTPREVKEFYKSFPKDSLPYLPAEVEIFQIVIKPPWSEAEKEKARTKLEGIREEIVDNGKDFYTMAKLFSEDGSRDDGGSLGEFGRGDMVPEFEEVAFTMEEGTVSHVFQSPFGFHIIKLHRRLGDRVRASHILIMPKHVASDDDLAIKNLNEIKEKIESGRMSFEEAAIEYSQDPNTKDCGGCITNPNTGEHYIPMDQLDSDLFLKVDELKEGEISEPKQLLISGATDKIFHIVYLKNRRPPHLANLKDDYQKLRKAALQNKQLTEMQKWFERAKENIYIEIMDEECLEALQNWN